MQNVVDLKGSTSSKFQNLCNALNDIAPTIQNIENQYGTLGMVARVEQLLERIITHKLGWNVRISAEIRYHYIIKISIHTPIPVLYLSRRFSIDLIKAARKGDVCPVVKELRNQLIKAVNAVKTGHDPFSESVPNYSFSYIIVEASTADGCFHAALPVNALSLVDTDDADTAYIAKELKHKKNHFILEPTKEYLQATLLDVINSYNIDETTKRKYYKIIKEGKYKIIKDHIQEDLNNCYKILSKKVLISNIHKQRG